MQYDFVIDRPWRVMVQGDCYGDSTYSTIVII